MPVIANAGGGGWFQGSSTNDNNSYAGMSPEMAAQEQALNRREQIARMLMQKSLAPREGTQAGRFFVPAGWAQGVGQLGEAALGAWATHEIGQERNDLHGEQRRKVTDASRAYQMGANNESSPEGRRQAIADLLMSGDPRLARIAELQIASDERRETAKAAQASKEPIQVDAGDRILFIKDGQVINTIPKGTAPKPPEPFTLSPGQKRFDQSGAAVASVEPAPDKPMVVPPGGTLVKPDSTTITVPPVPDKPIVVPPGGTVLRQGNAPYTAPPSDKPVTVSQGGAVVSPSGTVLYQAPAAPEKEKLAPGEHRKPDGTIELVPGSIAYRTQSDKHAKDIGALQNMDSKTDLALKKIDTILDSKNEGAFNSNFGGYNAKYGTQYLPGKTQDIRNEIESLKQNLKMAGFELIRQGGSIGQMTEREWPIVQDMIERIDPLMGEKAARTALGDIKQYLLSIRGNAHTVYDTEWSGSQFHKGAAQSNADTPQRRATDKPGAVLSFDSKGNPIK